MYWGEELVAIYNEAYIGKYYLYRHNATILTRRRTGWPETSHADGTKLQSCLGRNLG